MGFGRNAGGGGRVWCLLLLAGAAMAVAATTGGAEEVDGTAIAKPDAAGSAADCMDLCYGKFLDDDDETEEDLWKCIGNCPALNHGTGSAIRHAAARAIRHVIAAATKPDVVGFPSCTGVCYEQFDGKSEDELEKCIDDCPELDHAVLRAIRQVV